MMWRRMMVLSTIYHQEVWLLGKILKKIWPMMKKKEYRWIRGHRQHWIRLYKWMRMSKISSGKGQGVTPYQTWPLKKKMIVSTTRISKITSRRILGTRESLSMFSNLSEILDTKFKSTSLSDERLDVESKNCWVVNCSRMTWRRRICTREWTRKQSSSWRNKP